MIGALIYALAVLFAAGETANTETPVEPTFYDYRVVNTYPHDRSAFTQGLFLDGGMLYESTGQYGASQLRKTSLKSGRTLQSVDLPARVFGEGSVAWKNNIIVLTWRNGEGFIFDKTTLEKKRSFLYSGEGWGLTHDGERLIMSDGTSELRFLNPRTFQELRRLQVTFRGDPLPNLNELEWINGEIFANVWRADAIVRIDPETGVVTGVIDMRGLLTDQQRAGGADVLNGIAYDAENDQLFVTGKYWPALFEIELFEKTP